MNKTKLFLTVLALVALFLIAFKSANFISKDETQQFNKTGVAYLCEQGKTAFELLQNNYQVEFSESTYGKLVTSIDGQKQTDGKYWLYSIDDQEATVGADAYNCKNKEQIKWELK